MRLFLYAVFGSFIKDLILMEILVLFVVLILLSSFTVIPFIRFLQTRGNQEFEGENSFLLVVGKYLALSVIISIPKVFLSLAQEHYFITTNLKIYWL